MRNNFDMGKERRLISEEIEKDPGHEAAGHRAPAAQKHQSS
jgi:hypothetical protein